MEDIKVFGHKSPDLDTIAGSIATAKLLELRGNRNVKAYRLGNLNKEAKFVFEKYNIKEIDLLETVEDNQVVVMVDHNNFLESVNNIENAKIKMVIDHHAISNFSTKEPLEYIAKPVGSSATIVYSLLKEYENIEKEIYILLLAAIISDTLLFKSPTVTKEDVLTAKEIAKKIGVEDITKFGLEILKAGTDSSDLTEKEILMMDCKKAEQNDTKFSISQINVVDFETVLSRQEKIIEEMKNHIIKEDMSFAILAVTDIINCNSEIIFVGNDETIVEKAFNVKLENNRAFLKGCVSRKKQILPKIKEVL